MGSNFSDFAEQEDATTNYRGDFVTLEDTARVQFVINLIGTCVDASDITDDENFGLHLENEVAVSIFGVSISTAKLKVHYLNLSKKWGIFPDIKN